MRLVFSSSLLLCGLAPAQVVSPSFYTNCEGSAGNVFPFGNTTVPFRFEQVHDNVPTMVVSGLAFRHSASIANFPAHSVTVDLWISTASANSGGATNNFATNHGSDKAQVISAMTVNHPGSDSRCVPGEFILRYPFQAPFPFVGGINSLCWETHVTAKTQTSSITHDAISGTAVANPPLAVSRGGVGCIATGQTLPMLATGSSAMTWPTSGTLIVTTTRGPSTAPIFHFIGLTRCPAVLLPLTNGFPSGPCYLDLCITPPFPFLINSGATGATGAWTSSVAMPVPLPMFPSCYTVYSQILAVDLAANSLGIVTSNLVGHNVVPPTPASNIARVYLSGSLGATGTLSLASSLVTQIF